MVNVLQVLENLASEPENDNIILVECHIFLRVFLHEAVGISFMFGLEFG